MSCQEKTQKAIDLIRERRSIVVALSGGVDSAVVAALAHRALGEKSLAVTIDSPLTSSRDLDNARRLTAYLGMNHTVIELNELEIPGFVTNPTNRCYLCKKFRYGKLKEFAVTKGYQGVADGTNLSDLKEFRPGLKAAGEMTVIHPLVEAGITKEESSTIAEALCLPVASEPHNSCVAARLPYGESLSLHRLKRIDDAENRIRNIVPVKILRVRDHGVVARIETSPQEQKLFLDPEAARKVNESLNGLGYQFVTLDLLGYRFGSFDEKSAADAAP
jgi:uncharacterized protein